MNTEHDAWLVEANGKIVHLTLKTTGHRGCYYCDDRPGNFFRDDPGLYWERKDAYVHAIGIARRREQQARNEFVAACALTDTLLREVGA